MSGLQDAGLLALFCGVCGVGVLEKPQHEIPQAATTV